MYKVIHVPFYLDDFSSIINNTVFTQGFDLKLLWANYASRIVTYVALSTQYQAFGNEPSGFHIISVSIHLLVGGLIFLLIQALSAHHSAEQEKENLGNSYFGLIAASIFTLHPQNTQALVYVVQQAVLWTSLFYITSMYCFVKWRMSTQNKRWGRVYLLITIIAALLAVFSKQTAVTLPLALLLIEWLFFGSLLYRMFYALCVSGLAVLLLWFYFSHWQIDVLLANLDAMSRETVLISRIDYFINQLQILWHYIFQFFSLSGYRLEYDFLIKNSWDRQTTIQAVGVLLLLIVAFFIRNRFKFVTFGVYFYFLAHLVESSFLPIKDIVFEHRTYLPNVGMSILVGCVLFELIKLAGARLEPGLNAFRGRQLLPFSLLLLIIPLSLKTSERIEQWTDRLTFYGNEVKLSPKSPRATGEFAAEIAKSGNCPLAIGYFSHAISLYEMKHKSALGIQPEMLLNYIECLRTLGIVDKADYWELDLLKQVKEPNKRSMILSKRGVFYLKRKDFKRSVEALEEAFKLNSNDYVIVMNYAISLINIGQFENGKRLLKHGLQIKPNDQVAQDLLKQLDKLSTNLE